MSYATWLEENETFFNLRDIRKHKSAENTDAQPKKMMTSLFGFKIRDLLDSPKPLQIWREMAFWSQALQ